MLTEARIPKDYDLRKDGITQSLLMGYLKCRVSFLLTLNKWQSDEKKSTFAYGSLTHEILDKIYTHYQLTNGELPNDIQIRVWINKYVKQHKDWLAAKDSMKGEQIKVNCFVLVTEYMRYYAKDFEKIDIIGAEDVFDVNFQGFKLRGKKDLRFRIDGRKWLIETKTMARIEEEALTDKLAFDFQNLFYITAEEIEVPTESTIGVLYNIVRNPSSKADGKSMIEYERQLRAKVRKTPEHYFVRFEIPYLQKDKRAFRKDLISILWEIDGLLSGKVPIYRNFKNCVGRFRCSYLRACASDCMSGFTQNRNLFSELEEST